MDFPASNKKNKILLIDASSYSITELHILLKSLQSYNKVLLLITGNPYPYIKHFGNYSMLMSFSDTDESLRQLALCLKGVFEPKISHPCLPGNTQ